MKFRVVSFSFKIMVTIMYVRDLNFSINLLPQLIRWFNSPNDYSECKQYAKNLL